MPSEHATQILEAARLRLVLLTVSGAAFLDFLDVTVVNLAFTKMGADFGNAAVGDLAWVISGYAVTFAAFLTPAGRIADIAGRRRIFLAGTILFVASSLACALAPSLGVLIAGRLVQGAAAAMTLPAGLGIVLAASPPEKRAAAVGIWGAAAAIAAIVGPSVGGMLVDAVGWRAVFLINVPVGALIAVGAARLVPELPRHEARLPDLAGTVLLAAGIGAVVLALTQAPEWGWGDPTTVGAAAAGLVLTGIALLRSRTHPAPAIESSMWRIRQFSGASLASVLAGAGVYSWMLLCVLFLTGVWGYSELEAGLAMTPGAVTGALAAALVGRRLERGGYGWAIGLGGLAMAAVGLFLVLELSTQPEFVAVWLPAGLVVGAAMGAMSVGASTAAATAVAPARFAAATGLSMTARQVGGAVGIAGLAAILQSGLPEQGIDAYLTGFVMCTLCAVAVSVAARRVGAGAAPATAAAAEGGA